MCGIVGAIAQRNVSPILLEGLRRLEYRGYDSAGIALLTDKGTLDRRRTLGKVEKLATAIDLSPFEGRLGIAHTRWATHGLPSEQNAHPHICRQRVAVVHNGIIENHQSLREAQTGRGHQFTSQTDTEVIVHQVYDEMETGLDLLSAVRKAVTALHGAYALGVIATDDPTRMIAARKGSPLVIGIGIGEHFIASDVAALLPVTRRFMFLEEGDIADITIDRVVVYAQNGDVVERPIRESELSADAAERGPYRHFMLKEIHEQPRAISETLEARLGTDRVLPGILGPEEHALLEDIEEVQIIACGTSYHAGLVAKYWFEGIAGVRCNVEVASEFRYRRSVVRPGTLFVTISQSGETADTLAALRQAKEQGFRTTLTVCNVPESSLVRESDLSLMTRAGPEIGVASTKAFTTQLVALLMLVTVVGRRHRIDATKEASIVRALTTLPAQIEAALHLDEPIHAVAEDFAELHHALFLGRGVQYPVSLEGALKLKEISYIHAEAYPAGELKHGPLALVDADMPVVTVAPNDELLEKLKSNLEEVRARGGRLYVFADDRSGITAKDDIRVVIVPTVDEVVTPMIYTVPLQLLAYHVAVLRGTDVDQPRNLAKSVTVE
ncbi:MAG: glutamine--fructose-6-phosphate transaminase (isomerizing) [Gammaproteobacteria bacterium]|nr:glutamine--fructose-6-phosphate transaminase (isomerizing) [Gammaproteobacteria bacterium]